MSQATSFGGPRCQSCGIFIMNPSEFGTSSTGALAIDYCRYCYKKGVFTEPDITLEEMVDKLSVAMKTNPKITDEQAKEMARSLIVTLKRWKREDPV